MADLPGARGLRGGSDISGRRGGEPVGGFGVGNERHLGRVGVAILDDVDAPWERAARGIGAD